MQPWHRRWYLAVNALATVGVLAAGVASGLTPADPGLGRDRLRAGVGLGMAVGWPVVAAYGAGVLIPATRPLLNDQRVAGLDRRQLIYQVLLRIPVGTVAWEEVAFRGVLRAALRRVLGEPAATVVGSAVFGLWHVRPTVEALEVNGLAGGRGARVFAVTAVMGGTAGAGAVLCLLRERSGSLAAPVLLHLAANCTGALASTLAARDGLHARPVRGPRRRPGLRRRPGHQPVPLGSRARSGRIIACSLKDRCWILVRWNISPNGWPRCPGWWR